MTAIGARAVAAAASLRPLGLSLLVSPPDRFVITDKPDEPETGQLFTSIEQVEAFIADRRRVAAPGVPSWSYTRPAPIKPTRPHVSGLVHYVSHGSPIREDGSQAYKSACRAAIVTEVPPWCSFNEDLGDGCANGTEGVWLVGLCVLNPTGQFFSQGIRYDGGTFTGPEREASPGEPLPQVTCDDLTFEGGTWHWCSA